MRQPIEYIAYSRHWWDRVNGNSYFSAQVFDIRMNMIAVIPFQYGDYSHAEDIIVNTVQSINEIHEHKHDTWRKIYFDRNDTTKRHCKALGEATMEDE